MDKEKQMIESKKAIVEALGMASEGGDIVSIFTLGSHKNEGENEASDIDVTVVFKDEVYRVKERRENVQDLLKQHYTEKVKFWPASEDMYLNPERRMRLTPPEETDLDGPDELARLIGFYINVNSSHPIEGKNLEDLIQIRPSADKLDGYEFINVVTRDFAKGAFNRNKDQIVSKLSSGSEDMEEVYHQAFDSYLEKRSAGFKDLDKFELDVMSEILTKDNDLAKASLRAFYGLHVLRGGNFLGSREGNKSFVYSEIRKKAKKIIAQTALKDIDDISKFVDDIYHIKLNSDDAGSPKWINWNWDPAQVDITNEETLETYGQFFDGVLDVAHTLAFREGLYWDLIRLDAIDRHNSRNMPELIKLVASERTQSFAAVKPQLNSMVDFVETHLEYFPEFKEIVESKEILDELIAAEYSRDQLLAGRVFSLLHRFAGEETYEIFAEEGLEEHINETEQLIMSGLDPSTLLEKQFELADAYRELAKLESFKGDDLAAEAFLDKSIELNPVSLDSWRLKGSENILDCLMDNPSGELTNIDKSDIDQLTSSWKRLLFNVVDMENYSISNELNIALKKKSSPLNKRQASANYEKILEKKALGEFYDAVKMILAGSDSLEELSSIHQLYKLNPSRRGIGSGKLEDTFRSTWDTFNELLKEKYVQAENELLIEYSSKKKINNRDLLQLVNEDDKTIIVETNSLLFNKHNRSNADIFYLRGKAYEGLQEFTKAAASYEQAVSISEHRPSSNRISRISTILKNRFDSSEQYLHLPEKMRTEMIDYSRSLDIHTRTFSSRSHSDALLRTLDDFYHYVDVIGYSEEKAAQSAKILIESFTEHLTYPKQDQQLDQAKRILKNIDTYSEIPPLDLNYESEKHFGEYSRNRNE